MQDHCDIPPIRLEEVDLDDEVIVIHGQTCEDRGRLAIRDLVALVGGMLEEESK